MRLKSLLPNRAPLRKVAFIPLPAGSIKLRESKDGDQITLTLPLEIRGLW